MTITAPDWTARDRYGVPLAARRPLAESLAHDAAQSTREESRWTGHKRRADALKLTTDNDTHRRYTVTTEDGEPLATVAGIHAVYEYAEAYGLESYRYVVA